MCHLQDWVRQPSRLCTGENLPLRRGGCRRQQLTYFSRLSGLFLCRTNLQCELLPNCAQASPDNACACILCDAGYRRSRDFDECIQCSRPHCVGYAAANFCPCTSCEAGWTAQDGICVEVRVLVWRLAMSHGTRDGDDGLAPSSPQSMLPSAPRRPPPLLSAEPYGPVVSYFPRNRGPSIH